MQVLKDMSAKLGIAASLLAFIWQAKMWWALPIVVVVLLLGLITAFASSTGIGPFVYTLF